MILKEMTSKIIPLIKKLISHVFLDSARYNFIYLCLVENYIKKYIIETFTQTMSKVLMLFLLNLLLSSYPQRSTIPQEQTRWRAQSFYLRAIIRPQKFAVCLLDRAD